MDIIVLRRTDYDRWYPEDDMGKRKDLEIILKDFLDEGYKIIGMSENKIILEKEPNPSRR